MELELHRKNAEDDSSVQHQLEIEYTRVFLDFMKHPTVEAFADDLVSCAVQPGTHNYIGFPVHHIFPALRGALPQRERVLGVLFDIFDRAYVVATASSDVQAEVCTELSAIAAAEWCGTAPEIARELLAALAEDGIGWRDLARDVQDHLNT